MTLTWLHFPVFKSWQPLGTSTKDGYSTVQEEILILEIFKCLINLHVPLTLHESTNHDAIAPPQ